MRYQRRSPNTSPRSAAKTPYWQVNDEATSTIVTTSAYGMFSSVGGGGHGPTLCARTVKYTPNSPAKNISSLDSQTMVPMLTRFGRFSEWIRALMAGAEVVTGALWPPGTYTACRDGGGSITLPGGWKRGTTNITGRDHSRRAADLHRAGVQPPARDPRGHHHRRRPAARARRRPRPAPQGGGHRRGARGGGRRRGGPGDPRRRGAAHGRHGRVPAAQERDRRLPADHRHGPQARRPVARHLVAGRRRAGAPARPADRGRDGRGRAAACAGGSRPPRGRHGGPPCRPLARHLRAGLRPPWPT